MFEIVVIWIFAQQTIIPGLHKKKQNKNINAEKKIIKKTELLPQMRTTWLIR